MISAILLAAGQSKRMVDENKLLKKYKGLPLIKHSIQNILNSSIDELIIVLGHQKEVIKKNIETNKKIKFLYNPNFKNGIASSIKVGLSNLNKDTEAFFICLGDMPNVSKDIYNKLIKEKFKNKDKEIYVPFYEGKQANPILFSINMRQKLQEIEGDIGARKIIADNEEKVSKLTIKEKGIIIDFNKIDDFEF
tara:strand:+ start:308 stop:886 length:579 start_codon:yes stop_codon:yes gene_type:complete